MTNDEIRAQLIDTREEYVNLIRAELLGPGSEFPVPSIEHELISSSPLSRYSMGILYPQGNQVNHDNDEVPKGGFDESASVDDGGDTEELPADAVLFEKRRKGHRNYEFDQTANETLDEEVELSTQHMPSSMGVTFVVRGATDVVRGSVSFATYRKGQVEDLLIPYIPSDPDRYAVCREFAHIMSYDKEKKAFRLLAKVQKREIREIIERDTLPGDERDTLIQIAYRFAELCRTAYVREPHNDIEFVLDFSNGDYVDDKSGLGGKNAKITALRTRIAKDIWSLTVMLVNDMCEVPAKAHHCIFQPILRISSTENSFLFVENSVDADISNMDGEELSLDLLYRDKKIYGTGLGVSVDWDIDNDGVGSLWSDFFPVSEVPPMSFDLPMNEKISTDHLSMKYLSDLDLTHTKSKLDALTSLVDLYRAWVEDRERVVATLDARYQSAAVKNISECTRACERMYDGINTLRNNDNAYTAFKLANRAMFMQRVHLEMQSKTSHIDRYPGDEQIADVLRNMNYREHDDKSARWRPFQIAFLLMDINSIVNEESTERSIVDLIWFPTGGGKTEAYLGLTAFSIFYRRLTHHAESGGTAVIMRYTLRLLAAQQFTRAATLICACEYIRKDNGGHPHKHLKEKCSSYPRTLQRGSSSVYFPVVYSSLVIPPYADKLNVRIEQSSSFLECQATLTKLPEMREVILEKHFSKWLEEISLEIGASQASVNAVLRRKWFDGENNGADITSVKYRVEEYEALSGEVSTDVLGDFSREGIRKELFQDRLPHIRAISLIDKVRVVSALIGFSRINPTSAKEDVGFVHIKEAETCWYPAYEVRGEGIFIEFEHADIDKWIGENPEVAERAQRINENYGKSFIGQNRPRNNYGEISVTAHDIPPAY